MSQEGTNTPELVKEGDGLALVAGNMRLSGDFSRMKRRIRQSGLSRELLVRAAKPLAGAPEPLAVDATAGLGEDALVLAAAGYRVILFERDPKVAALLADALERAAEDAELAGPVSRMELMEGDATRELKRLECRPDLVYLDPMFPAKRGDAQAKKKLQILQMLEAPCEDEAELLEAAFAAHPVKIVIKRPIKGPWLAGVKPNHCISGKLVRYDVILPRP